MVVTETRVCYANRLCRFWDLSTKLIASSQIAVHPPRVGKGGLQGIFDGLEQLKGGKVSGVKLVYRIDDTPK